MLYELSHRQRRAILIKFHELRVAIPIQTQDEEIEPLTYARNSLASDLEPHIRDAELTEIPIAIHCTLNKDNGISGRIGKILTEKEALETSHFLVVVVVATLAVKDEPERVRQNIQWPLYAVKEATK